jgi:hypothetical protein
VSFLLSDECLVPQVDLDDSACKNTLKFSKKCFFCLDEQRAHDLVHDHLALVCRHQHPQSKEEFDRCPWQVWDPLHDPLAVDKQTVHHAIRPKIKGADGTYNLSMKRSRCRWLIFCDLRSTFESWCSTLKISLYDA